MRTRKVLKATLQRNEKRDYVTWKLLMLCWNHESPCLPNQLLVSIYDYYHSVWKFSLAGRAVVHAIWISDRHLISFVLQVKHHNDYVMITTTWTALMSTHCPFKLYEFALTHRYISIFIMILFHNTLIPRTQLTNDIMNTQSQGRPTQLSLV